MTISTEDFRDVLRHFASGVTLVTSRAGEQRVGLTVSAFSSVSATPPLVAVIIEGSHAVHPLLQADGGSFAVNLLAEEQEELSNRFAFVRDEDRFLVGSWGAARTGSPVLEESLAWLDCQVESYHGAGSHVLYLGRVVASRVNRPGEPPLVYWNRAYRRLLSEG